MIVKIWFTLPLLLLILACDNTTASKDYTPQAISGDDIGYYCNMIVENHSGPKAQITLSSTEKTFWFTSVRDAIAFTLLPDEPKNIGAFFVTAMDEADWQHPEEKISNWIHAQSAWFVVSSERRGGMGQMEAIPFKQRQVASDFTDNYGGKIVSYKDIPSDYILGNTDL